MFDAKKIGHINLSTQNHHAVTTDFFLSGFVLLQLKAATIISNFTLLISEDNGHDDDDVECNGDNNRKNVV